MKDITIHVDDETHGLAHVRAKEMGKALPDLVREYLKKLAWESAPGRASKHLDAKAAAERRGRRLRELFEDFDARGVGLDPRYNLTREELYDRARARADIAEAKAKEERRRAEE